MNVFGVAREISLLRKPETLICAGGLRTNRVVVWSWYGQENEHTIKPASGFVETRARAQLTDVTKAFC
jgi:hypothetical protein